MRRVVEIVTRDEYETWLAEQKSTYMTTVRGTENDPRLGQLMDSEIKERAQELRADFQNALDSDKAEDKTILLRHVFYETGSASLSDLSKYELDNLSDILKSNGNVRVELAGHTDSEGDDATNLEISRDRAQNVMSYLTNKGLD